jgi:hypothetical protein
MQRLATFLLFLVLAMPGNLLAQDKTETQEDDKKEVVEDKQSFTQTINAKVISITDGIEKWRKEKSVAFKASMEKTEERRMANKDAKPAMKVLTMLHIYGLAALLFVFSLQFVFYTAAILIGISIIRRIFNIVFGMFRRE